MLPDGRVLKANRTFLTWLGHDLDALAGRPFTDLLSAGSRMFHETHVKPLLLVQGQVKEIALNLVRADGSVLPVLVNAGLQRTDTGAPGTTRIAVFDATERRHYEQELLAAKRRAEESERRSAELARTLQETLMPPRNPSIDGLDVAAAYRPAGDGREIGGDFYDVFELADHDWIITLGDVSGKGVEAAVVATLARHTIRAMAVSEPSPAKILTQLNRVLGSHPTERFCTAIVLRLSLVENRWEVTLSNGGHPPAIHLQHPAAPRMIGGPTALVGAFDDARYVDVRFDLDAGATVLLYTDGITEARGPEGFYDEPRLLRLLESSAPDATTIISTVMADVLRFQGDMPTDDIAMIALHSLPA